MDFEKYIKEQLDAGVSMEDVMNDIANVANKVMADRKQKDAKTNAAQNVVEALNEFVTVYYPDLATALFEDDVITGETLVELLDGINELNDALGDLAAAVKQKPAKKELPVKFKVSKKPEDADAILASFLKSLGI